MAASAAQRQPRGRPWWHHGSNDTRLIEGAPRLRLRYEFVVVLCVRAPSWKDAVLSRFMTEDRRADEGRERAEQVLRAMSEAGLTLKVKRHLADDGAQLLMVFVTAGAARLQKQSQRLRVERWLQEEGVGDMSRYGSELMLEGKSARQPHRKVVRVGGLHYFAPTQPMGGDSGATGANGGGGAGGALAGEGEAGALAGLACTSVDVRGGVGSGGVDGFGGGGGAAPGAAPLQLPASPGGSVYSGPTAAQHGNTAGEGALAAGHPNRFSTNAEFSPGPGFGAESALGTPPVAGSGAAGCSLPGVGVDGASANPAATFGAPAAFGAPSPRDAMPNGDVAPSSPVHEPGAPSLEEAAPLSAAARVELVHHILITPPARGGAGMAARMKADARRATILHMLPLHDPLFNASLYRHANQLNPWALAARDAFISDVRAHFGEKVAFCYAFNIFYSTWLGAAAIPGTFLWLLGFFAEEQAKQLLPFYAVFMVLWSLLLCKAWERKEHALAIRWGVANARQSDAVRPAFTGWPRTSPVTGETELHYPQYRRGLKYCVTGLVTAAQVAVMVALIALLYSAFFWIQSTNFSWLETLLLNLSCSTAWGISLELLNWIVWSKLAAALNRFENHKTSTAHENYLIAKVFVFFFIDCFLWFFILAFFQIPFGSQIDGVLNSLGVVLDKPFSREDWVPRLGMTIGAVLSVTQFSMLVFADAYVPYWWSKRMLRRAAALKAKNGKGSRPGGRSASSRVPANGAHVLPPASVIPPGGAGLDHATVELSRAGRIPGGGGGIADLVGGGVVRGGADIAPARAVAGGGGTAGGRFGLGPKGPTSGKMSRVLAQANAFPYDPMLDYSGMVIQFGFVSFFSVSWPLAPLVCLLHTMLRLRSNCLRLTKLSQRPLPESVNGIGLWRTLLGFEALVAVLLNCLIVSVSTDQLDHISCWTHSLMRDEGECQRGEVPTSARFLIAAAAEHVLLVLAFLIIKMVPSQRKDVRMKLARQAFLFKRRYYDSIEAEALLEGGTAATSRSSFGASTASSVAGPGGRLPPEAVVDYTTAWHSGSELSDGMEEIEAQTRVSALAAAGAPAAGAARAGEGWACGPLVGPAWRPHPAAAMTSGLVLKGSGVGAGGPRPGNVNGARERAAAANAARRGGGSRV